VFQTSAFQNNAFQVHIIPINIDYEPPIVFTFPTPDVRQDYIVRDVGYIHITATHQIVISDIKEERQSYEDDIIQSFLMINEFTGSKEDINNRQKEDEFIIQLFISNILKET
jgi:hypothetical protein